MLIKVNWKPSYKQLRGFGLTSLVAFATIGALIYFRHRFMGHPLAAETAATTARVLWCVSIASGIAAIVAPRILWLPYVALTAATLPIGFVVSQVLMWTMYYVVVTPLGMLMRATGWDAMSFRFDRDTKSYWSKRAPNKNVRSYFRQY